MTLNCSFTLALNKWYIFSIFHKTVFQHDYPITEKRNKKKNQIAFISKHTRPFKNKSIFNLQKQWNFISYINKFYHKRSSSVIPSTKQQRLSDFMHLFSCYIKLFKRFPSKAIKWFLFIFFSPYVKKKWQML